MRLIELSELTDKPPSLGLADRTIIRLLKFNFLETKKPQHDC
jgi:hypothetical protein